MHRLFIRRAFQDHTRVGFLSDAPGLGHLLIGPKTDGHHLDGEIDDRLSPATPSWSAMASIGMRRLCGAVRVDVVKSPSVTLALGLLDCLRRLAEMLLGAGSGIGRCRMVVPAVPVGLVVRSTSDLASIAFV